MKTIREYIFSDMSGCLNHNCVVTGKRSGIGTNAMCSCLSRMNRTQLQIIQSRVELIANLYPCELPIDGK
jgi:hypothetical protein